MLNYYTHKEIDLEKWDQCLQRASNANVYCTSWYLNIIHPGWDALIFEHEGLYHRAMPLLFRRRGPFLIHAKPILAQRLGIFSIEHDHIDLAEVFPIIKNKFSVFHYPLDPLKGTMTPGLQVVPSLNFTLPLNPSYQALYSRYRRDRKARLNQARASNLVIEKKNEAGDLVRLFKENVAPKIPGGVALVTYQRMAQLIHHATSNKSGFVIQARTRQGHLLSSAFFIRYRDSLIYVFSATNPGGKKTHANTLLLDHVIREHAGKGLILDFKGSDEPGIADFYRSFGGAEEIFHVIKYGSWSFRNYLKVRKFLGKKEQNR